MPHAPRQGSRAFWHRKRARSEVPRISTWPHGGRDQEPKLQGFAGYKAGMTHAHIVDYRPHSTTSGQEILMPVTVVEVPTMRVAAVRGYIRTPYGLKTKTEAWAEKLDKALADRVNIPKKPHAEAWKELESGVDDLRVLVHTQPTKVSGIPKKTPELMEVRVAGGTIEKRLEFAKKLLGKEVDVGDVFRDGDMVDAIGVTTGHGFESRVVRFGTKLLHHKNSKHRRMIGTQGPWHPNYITATVPSDGQRGYHQRTEYNKRVLRVGESGEEINPAGGFIRYGEVRNKYLLIHGSLPGPTKRLIRFREAIRYARGIQFEKAQVSYVSRTSKQGA